MAISKKDHSIFIALAGTAIEQRASGINNHERMCIQVDHTVVAYSLLRDSHMLWQCNALEAVHGIAARTIAGLFPI
jgi:hypothetical protein